MFSLRKKSHVMATVLILGNGSREHALAAQLSNSQKVAKVLVAPGNGGTTGGKIHSLNLDLKDLKSVVDWCRTNVPDIVVVGPEEPLNAGIKDLLTAEKIACFGPTRDASQIECDKAFAKHFMRRHGIPTPDFHSFSDAEEAIAFVTNECTWHSVVVKAAGLAAGKGVLVAETKEQAIDQIRAVLTDGAFGSESTVVLEERVQGTEVSVLAFCDGSSYRLMPVSQDHKRLKDGDMGPNTGGMGAVAPVHIDPCLLSEIEERIIRPAVEGMRLEDRPFVGVLYAGVMLTPDSGPVVLEYNCRFGDPETQVILPLLQSDLLDILTACTNRTLNQVLVRWDTEAAACGVVLASENYPQTPAVNRPITGISAVESEGLRVFHGGTKRSARELVSSGGRVLTVVSVSESMEKAVRAAKAGVSKIQLKGSFFRGDIGANELSRRQQEKTQEKGVVSSGGATGGESGLTYKSAGVDIEAGERLVQRIRSYARDTQRPGVMDQLGGFAALFDLSAAGFDEKPILVSGTDGVGTKLLVAIESGIVDTVGRDLVAMCVNDILVHGAEPLFFLDYFATGCLDVDVAAAVIAGISDGCRESNCALVGGETAEMPGMYASGDWDLAGFAVGAVSRANILPRTSDMRAGDVVIGLPSSGLHSNGFSLVRKLLTRLKLHYSDDSPFDDKDSNAQLGPSLLTPTRLYVRPLLPLVKSGLLKALAHITGGGIVHNVPRILPSDLAAELDARCWSVHPVFQWIQQQGHVSDQQMLSTFNCGLGMLVIVDARDEDTVLTLIKANGIPDASVVGKLIARTDGTEDAVIIRNFSLSDRLIEPRIQKKKRVAVLISGTGSNLQALIDGQSDKEYEVVLVVSNIPGVQGLERANAAGIGIRVIPHVGKKRKDFDFEVHDVLVAHDIDIVCLAGFMRILSPDFVRQWEGRLLNVHPSLLPAFPGMRAHEEALAAGVRVHGCTVHFVDEGVDTGAIIVQESVPVLSGDTVTSLAERVKTLAEHRVYPTAVHLLASGQVALHPITKKAVWRQE